MNAISSIYIPHLEFNFSAEYVANAFSRNGIAEVSKVFIERNKSRKPARYNRAYVDIKSWCDTEVAYNFVRRLRDASFETRFIHNDDNWWVVEINKYPHKTDGFRPKGQLTVFKENEFINAPDYAIDMAEPMNDTQSTDASHLTEEDECEWVDAPIPWTQEIMHDGAKLLVYLKACRDMLNIDEKRADAKADADDYEEYLRDIEMQRQKDCDGCDSYGIAEEKLWDNICNAREKKYSSWNDYSDNAWFDTFW